MRQILPFKNAGTGANLQNTTQSGVAPVPQEVIDTLNGTRYFHGEKIIWPSAEAAFHAQKLIGYYCDLHNSQPNHVNLAVIRNMINEILEISDRKQYFSSDFTNLVATNFDILANHDRRLHTIKNSFGKTDAEKKRNAFDQVCGTHYHRDLQDKKNAMVEFPGGSGRLVPRTYQIMVAVQYARILQHLQNNERSVALDCAKQGIFPVETSRSDVVWATGPNGDGENLLGIAILEAANMVLNKHPKFGTTQILNPWETWKTFTTRNNVSAQLKHDVLENTQQAIPLNVSQPQPTIKENNNPIMIYNRNRNYRLVFDPKSGEAEYHFIKDNGVTWEPGNAPKDPNHFFYQKLAELRGNQAVSQNPHAFHRQQHAARQPLLPKDDGCPCSCAIM